VPQNECSSPARTRRQQQRRARARLARPRGRGPRKGAVQPQEHGFKGDIKDIEDHVFDLIGGAKQAIKYDLTLDKICVYIGTVFDEGNNLVSCIKDNLTPASFPDPADLSADASQAAKYRWRKACNLV
jgi:hypothetical protein